MGYCFMVNGWPMKKKPKPSAPKAVKPETSGERAGTKPDQAGRVKRGKARPKSPAQAVRRICQA